LPYFLLDRFARRRQIPGSERKARVDIDDSFDHGRLAENRIEQSTQTAFTRGLRFSIAPTGATLEYTSICCVAAPVLKTFIGRPLTRICQMK
jgi:hypothetical protein